MDTKPVISTFSLTLDSDVKKCNGTMAGNFYVGKIRLNRTNVAARLKSPMSYCVKEDFRNALMKPYRCSISFRHFPKDQRLANSVWSAWEKEDMFYTVILLREGTFTSGTTNVISCSSKESQWGSSGSSISRRINTLVNMKRETKPNADND